MPARGRCVADTSSLSPPAAAKTPASCQVLPYNFLGEGGDCRCHRSIIFCYHISAICIPSARACSGDTLPTHAPEPHTLLDNHQNLGTLHSSDSWERSVPQCPDYLHACSRNNPSRESLYISPWVLSPLKKITSNGYHILDFYPLPFPSKIDGVGT